MSSKRLDILVLERGLAESREKAQALILAGRIWSGTKRLDKAGTKITEDTPLELEQAARFVSRAGDKLQHGLETFSISVKDRVCLDIGASTGGFTDCLLQNGAVLVAAVDVGYGQFAARLRNDPRVLLLEKTNARYLELQALCAKDQRFQNLDLVTADVSFISLRTIVSAIRSWPKVPAEWVLLFKPQFEVGPEHIGKGGRVRDEQAVRRSLESFHEFMLSAGFQKKNDPQKCPVVGKKSGNVEYLVHYEFSHA